MYKRGIYFPLEELTTITIYPVKLIGWAQTSSGYPYWIVETTLGSEWGINGTAYIDALNVDIELATLSFDI